MPCDSCGTESPHSSNHRRRHRRESGRNGAPARPRVVLFPRKEARVRPPPGLPVRAGRLRARDSRLSLAEPRTASRGFRRGSQYRKRIHSSSGQSTYSGPFAFPRFDSPVMTHAFGPCHAHPQHKSIGQWTSRRDRASASVANTGKAYRGPSKSAAQVAACHATSEAHNRGWTAFRAGAGLCADAIGSEPQLREHAIIRKPSRNWQQDHFAVTSQPIASGVGKGVLC